MNKSILLVINNGFVSRSLLRSDFFPAVKKHFARVILLVPGNNLNFFKDKYERGNVEVSAIPEVSSSWLRKKLFKLMKYSVYSQTAKVKLMRNFYYPDGRVKRSFSLIYFLPFTASYYLSKYGWWRKFLRKVYFLFCRTDKNCLSVLQKYKPDAVYARYTSPAVTDFNLELFRAAKEAGITTVGNIYSWDNLYSKIFITTHTDYLVVPNEIIKKDAVKMGDFKEEKVKVVGIPHFDHYFKKDFLMSKKEFFSFLGADPGKKLVVFAGSADFLRVEYKHFASLFDFWTKNELKNTQFYLRPHPKKSFVGFKEKFVGNPSLIFEKEKASLKEIFEFSEDDNRLLCNLLYYADLVICVFSTIIIDGAIFNKPSISINYSGGLNDGYYYAVERNAEFEHIGQILKHDALSLAHNDEELLRQIKFFMQNPQFGSDKRKVMVKEQISKNRGTAGETLAEEIIRLVGNKN